MTGGKQRHTQQENVQKAQQVWRNMTSPGQHTRMHPEGQTQPSGEARYYHIELHERRGFERFHTHDAGADGGILRIAARRPNGTWDTQAWLIATHLAHVEEGRLVADHDEAREVIERFDAAPERREGSVFSASLARARKR